MNPVLLAFEHETIEVSAMPGPRSLGVEECERLSAIGERYPGFCQRGHRQVRLAQYCGVVSLGSRVLEVAPKLGRGKPGELAGRSLLLQMLQTVHELPRLTGSAGQKLEQAPLIDALASIFFDELLRLVKAGLHRAYASESNNLQTIKGRLLIGAHVACNSGRMDRALCEFDELTADVGVNRALALALKTIRPWLSQTYSQRRWIELMAAFEGVAQASRYEANGIRLTRQTSRYGNALRFAKWIIDMLSPALRGGSEVAPAMLFDMNILFESYVAACLARQAERGVEVLPQHNAMHLARTSGKGAYQLKPDIVVTRGPEVLLVADTKWKVLEEDRFGRIRPTSADMYQMNAYASAYKCQEMALIYPSFPGLDTQLTQHPTSYELPAGAGTVSLHITGVDLLADRLSVGAGSVGATLEKLLSHEGQSGELLGKWITPGSV